MTVAAFVDAQMDHALEPSTDESSPIGGKEHDHGKERTQMKSDVEGKSPPSAGSVQPKSQGTITRCAELEIGMNSVKP